VNRKVLTVLLCVFLVAGGCSFLAYRMIGARVNVARQTATTRVVSAAADIKLGTILTAANLSTAEIAGALPKGAILKPENAIGRGAISDLSQGEPILESRLAVAGSGGGLAATIRQGMRACAVKVDEVVGVAGFVTPRHACRRPHFWRPSRQRQPRRRHTSENASAEHRGALRGHRHPKGRGG